MSRAENLKFIFFFSKGVTDAHIQKYSDMEDQGTINCFYLILAVQRQSNAPLKQCLSDIRCYGNNISTFTNYPDFCTKSYNLTQWY